MKLKEVSENVWEVEKVEGMLVPVRIYASKGILNNIKDDDSIQQAINVSKLPGIIDFSIALPDMHQGYGFPIGGVAAFDLEDGVISPGGVGFDINCGVRILVTNIKKKEFMSKREKVVNKVQEIIPNGLGKGNKEKLSDEKLENYLKFGAKFAVEKGFGFEEDLKNCEDEGFVEDVDVSLISQRARARGKPQLGTLGSGNHFIEFQSIEEIFDGGVAKKLGLEKDIICVMIHCGSRGLGHQVASDYIQKMEKNCDLSNLPDRQLVYSPVKSDLGQEYLKAMNCAVNFAFANRQIIMHKIREVLGKNFSNYKDFLLRDVCHNIAKIEKHKVGGELKKVCVHRKGATRAFKDETVLIPGSMGTSSYILVGGSEAENLSFSSTAHGAGRVMGRAHAGRTIKYSDVKKEIEDKGIYLKSSSEKGVVQEAPEVYKDVDEVVDVSDKLDLAKKVARLNPLAVIKG